MNVTGKYIYVTYDGIPYRLCNQRCREWAHPYEYQHNGSTLTNAGCGIFAVANAACYLGGEQVIPEKLADFSCQYGGRGDDGTDRPNLLAAMQEHGWAEKCGFAYRFDGLRNDLEILHGHLLQGGAALCNLRAGHIVALVGGRTAPDGEKQVLAADPYSESADERVMPFVRECIPGSEVISPIPNERGKATRGFLCSYALFWVSLATVKDFNLLYRVSPKK